MRRIYLDNASLTPVRKEVVKEMKRYMDPAFGNPSSIHTEGVLAKKALTEARKNVAACLSAHPDEIVFTGSGTEANNIAILGVVISELKKGKKYGEMHFVTSAIEHASVLEIFKDLERRGAHVSYCGVNSAGIVEAETVKKALRAETILVSIMYVNNEIGTLQPIREIAKVIRHSPSRPLFHTDASQAALFEDLAVERLGVDLLTLDGHKIYGPRGIGMLYIKRGTDIASPNFGGGQERGLRSGTENLPAIMGFARALMLARQEHEKEKTRLTGLRDYTIERLLKIHPHSELNGSPTARIANNIHISIPGTDAEFLVLKLDAKGIAVSTKSSCLRDEDESYVLRALGKSDPKNGIRITLGRDTTKRDIDYLIKMIQ